MRDNYLYRFGPYELDTAKQELRKNQNRISLSKLRYRFLKYLIENRDILVEKEDLRKNVWDSNFISEHSYRKVVSHLRKVFGDSENDPKYIETSPGKGYRFIADVEEVSLNKDSKSISQGSDKQYAKPTMPSQVEPIGPWHPISLVPIDEGETLNGIKYKIYKLQHRYGQYFGRGKRYERPDRSNQKEPDIQTQFERHLITCELVKKMKRSLHLPEIKDVQPEPLNRAFWVIDEWIEGVTLAEMIEDGPVGFYKLPSIMRGIASGLKLLHKSNIIRRELRPENILVEKNTGRVVLTDLELTRVLDNLPTVTSKESFKKNPYIAPELYSDPHTNDKRVDLYSWGSIFFRVSTGKSYIPQIENEKNIELLRNLNLPSNLVDLTVSCLRQNSDQRPSSISKVEKVIRRWKVCL